MKAEAQDVAQVVAPPPLIYLATFVVGLLLNWELHVSFLPFELQFGLGLPLVVIGIIVFVWAGRTLLSAKTGVAFRKPTMVLVTEGPFRLTGNPIYLSVTLIYLGIAVSLNALWPVLLLPVVLVIIQREVIVREEQYLERRFGGEYLLYKVRVRRWL